MRIATIQGGVVSHVIEVETDFEIADDGKAAAGKAFYTIERIDAEPERVEYDTTLDAPDGSIFAVAPEGAAMGWLYQAGTFSPPGATVLTADELKAYAANARYAAEVGGIELVGRKIRTDRESQSLINGAVSLAQQDPSAPIDFKGADGWVQLDSATMISIGLAVARHVRACFSKERQASDAIDAGTITTTAEIDALFSVAGE